METVTCRAPVNIAAIKYWGKRDEKLNLPVNDSISVTLSTKLIYAKTTVAASPDFENDQMWLNGREESFSNPRLLQCVNEIREKAKNSLDPKIKSMAGWKIHICSANNFPTAAGLASSAAGYACLVYSLAKLFQLEGDYSAFARRGSGSACRSIHGGFVMWEMGKEKNGVDSIAKQIAPASHWKEMRILILVVSSLRKSVGSTESMQRSVLTSGYLKSIIERGLKDRVDSLTDAILQRDFETFAEITMKESNRLHSICLDTYPPVTYLNDTSHYIIRLVHMLNDYYGKPKVAYSFDAGPNACLFLLEENVQLILSLVNHYLPPKGTDNGEPYFRGEHVDLVQMPQEILRAIPVNPLPSGSLKGLIYCPVGDGPEVLDKSESLLNKSGFPKTLIG